MPQEANLIDRADTPPRVLVVSDILLYREGVASGLARDGAMSVLAAAAGRQALSVMQQAAIEVVLLDASAAEALAFARVLRLNWPGVPVIGFGICDDVNGLACAEAGLVGFIGRDGTIAELVADGLSNKEVALELRIGPATVKNHVHNILEKLHVARRGAIGCRVQQTPMSGG